MTQFYELEARNGLSIFKFSELKNKVVLIVNVASLCGYTPQYKELQTLYDTFPRNEFDILAFPCGQFGDQELNNLEDIRAHVSSNFNVSFPILSKVIVNGEDTDPVFRYLKEQKPGFLGFKGLRWNFEKFVVNKFGNVVARFESGITPKQLLPLIEELIAQNPGVKEERCETLD